MNDKSQEKSRSSRLAVFWENVWIFSCFFFLIVHSFRWGIDISRLVHKFYCNALLFAFLIIFYIRIYCFRNHVWKHVCHYLGNKTLKRVLKNALNILNYFSAFWPTISWFQDVFKRWVICIFVSYFTAWLRSLSS